jgi:hypothetical protein
LLVGHQVRHQQSLYGIFGVVLGLLAWLHLQATLTLYAVEADVVRTRRLWPRSLAPPPLTEGDQRAYREYALTTRRRPESEQDIDVIFPASAAVPAAATPAIPDQAVPEIAATHADPGGDAPPVGSGDALAVDHRNPR